MTVTFGDGTVVQIGTPRPSIVGLSAPGTPAIALVPVKGDKGDDGDTGPAGAGTAVSTDDSFDLPAPTGVGLEFVMVDGALDDIRFDGASL